VISYWAYNGAEGILAALWNTHDMKVALMKPSFVPNPDAVMSFSALQAANEVVGAGYTAGGTSLTGKAAPYTPASDRTDLQAADVTWGPGATFDTGFAVIYDNTDASKLIWAVIDFQATKSIVGGTFTVDFAAQGILYLTP
jgi:hypothetical protein